VLIRDVLKAGNSIDDIKARFPHVDGRVISGTKKHMENNSTLGTTPSSFPPPPAPAAAAAAPPSVPSARPAAVAEHNRTGLTPEASTVVTREGFKSDWQEYFLVKKMDPPGDGIKGTEYPPFDLKTLAERYGPGDYQIQHYREGKLYQTYRDRVALRDNGTAQNMPNNGIRPEQPRASSPVDDALKLASVIHNSGSEARASESAARHVEAAAKIEEVKGRVQVETSAQVALMQVVKDALAGKDTKDPIVGELMTLLKSNQNESKKSVETELEIMRARSKMEMDELRERAKLDREAERDRATNEMARFKMDLQERERIQNTFMTKMAEIEGERSRLNEEWRDKQYQEQQQMRESVTAELDERRRMNDEIIKMQRSSNDEYLKMRKEMGAGANDIKVAEIIERGITTSLDRIGARIDLLAGGKSNPGTTVKTLPAPAASGEVVTKVDATVVDDTKEAPKVFDEESLKAEFERPWFKQWKTEVVATLKKRAGGLKIDGSLMGQVLIDKLNTGEVKPMHIQWLLSRTWRKVSKDPLEPLGLLDYAAQSMTDEEMRVMATADGEAWFGEFIWFVAEIWNQNIAQARAQRAAT
jgi:hypothetical protein